MTAYVVDTDVFVEYLRARGPAAVRVAATPQGDLGMATPTLAELHFGALKSTNPAANIERLDDLILRVTLLAFDAEAARFQARVRKHLADLGQSIGRMDLLIAAIALAQDAVLVTNNVREFSRVPGLRIENWIAAEA